MSKKNPSFAELLRAARENAGLSQSDLARACRVPHQRINALESGAKSNPTWNTINALAKALGISPVQLLVGKKPDS